MTTPSTHRPDDGGTMTEHHEHGDEFSDACLTCLRKSKALKEDYARDLMLYLKQDRWAGVDPPRTKAMMDLLGKVLSA